MPLPEKVSDAVRRLNPSLYPAPLAAANFGAAVANASSKGVAIRQHRAPKLNKTEADFAQWLGFELKNVTIHAQAVRLELANGVTYTPDFFAPGGGGGWPAERWDQTDPAICRAWEVKGRHAWDDAIVKLKTAARVYPWVAFYLCTRQPVYGWKVERVLP